jgi:hypothetical protein
MITPQHVARLVQGREDARKRTNYLPIWEADLSAAERAALAEYDKAISAKAGATGGTRDGATPAPAPSPNEASPTAGKDAKPKGKSKRERREPDPPPPDDEPEPDEEIEPNDDVVEPLLLPGSPHTRPIWRAMRTKPDKSKAFFEAAREAKELLRRGQVTKQDAADFLQEAASRFRVIENIGQDAVQLITSQIGEVQEPAPESTTKQEGKASPGIKPYVYVLARNITIEANLKIFLIDGFLGRHEQSAWYGAPESGKSTGIIDAACRVASGLQYGGRVVMRGAVLYVAAERGMNVRRRVLAWRLEHGIDDFPLAVIDDAVDLRTGKVDADRIIDAAKRLGEESGHPVVWIIFDTLSRVLAGGDENSPRDMGALVASIDRIFRTTGAHCSLVHHTPLGESDRMRGHTSFNGAMDTTVRIEKRNGIVALEVDKASDLPDGEKPKLFFRFKSITLTADPHTTASILVQAEDDFAAVAAGGKKEPKNGRPRRMAKSAQAAMRALEEAISECGTLAPASNHIPNTVRVTTLDRWRDYAYRRGISPSEKPRARQAAFARASEYLIDEQIAAVWDNTVWLTGKR